MDSLFSSMLDTFAPLRLRKIKEKSPTPWYNEHTRALNRAARKMERSWGKTKLEVFRIAWRECSLSHRKVLKLKTYKNSKTVKSIKTLKLLDLTTFRLF